MIQLLKIKTVVLVFLFIYEEFINQDLLCTYLCDDFSMKLYARWFYAHMHAYALFLNETQCVIQCMRVLSQRRKGKKLPQ